MSKYDVLKVIQNEHRIDDMLQEIAALTQLYNHLLSACVDYHAEGASYFERSKAYERIILHMIHTKNDTLEKIQGEQTDE